MTMIESHDVHALLLADGWHEVKHLVYDHTSVPVKDEKGKLGCTLAGEVCWEEPDGFFVAAPQKSILAMKRGPRR